MRNTTLSLAAFTAACLATPVFGQLTITNPGFELPDVASNDFESYDSTAFPGWTPVSGSNTSLIFVIGEDSANVPNASSGDQSLSLAVNGTDTATGLFQSLGTLQANTDYSFSYEVGYRSDTDNPDYEVGLWGDTTGNGTPDTALHVRTQTDDATVAEGDVAMTSASSTIVNSSTFTASAIGNEFFFYIRADDATGSGQQVLFDSVSVIPEPGAYALIGGLLALVAVMLRRRGS